MKTILFAAAAAGLALAASTASAQQSPHAGGWSDYNVAAPFGPAYGSPALASSSSQSAHSGMPTYGLDLSQASPVMQAELLPTRGTQGAVNTANSLPPGFNDGTPEMQYAQSVERYFAERASVHYAARPVQPGG